MRRRLALAMVLALMPLAPAGAQQAEVKEAAQSANCKPTKLEVIKQVPGRMAETLYKVNCTAPKDSFVLVQCRDRTCTLMR
ncbi:MAG: hypothetical protein ACOVN0_16540 [Niveispirillum sp.]|uniref:hypothetical protein n=1 Tax=Niveispirillum sp. TaxID=1917217 RepID=UPI003BA5D321